MQGTEKNISALPRLSMKGRQLHDLEVMLVGGFHPVHDFMDEANYTSVVESMRLVDGTIFPIPIVLDVPSENDY